MIRMQTDSTSLQLKGITINWDNIPQNSRTNH